MSVRSTTEAPPQGGGVIKVQATMTGTMSPARCRPQRDIRPTIKHMRAMRAAPETGVAPATIVNGPRQASTIAVLNPRSRPPTTTAAIPASAGIAAKVAAGSARPVRAAVSTSMMAAGISRTSTSTIAMRMRRNRTFAKGRLTGGVAMTRSNQPRTIP